MKSIASAFAAFLLFGCISVDNREKIAVATLYPDNASVTQSKSPLHPAPVLTSALNVKFPPGTALENLKNYVEKLNGSCNQVQSGQPMRCSFVESSTVCIRTTISITAQTNSLNTIEHLDAVRIFDGC